MTVSRVGEDVPTPAQQAEKAIEIQVEEILSAYKGEKGDLIPILQQVQLKLGYLPEKAMRQVAKFIGTPESRVFGVATFYAQFKLVPTGRNVIKVCRGTGCYVRGAPSILTELENQLGIKAGETTADSEYSLETVACFGSCALAPVVVINDKVYGRATASEVKKMIVDSATDSRP
jgi:NADH-quinone oxidoreductase subunit E